MTAIAIGGTTVITTDKKAKLKLNRVCIIFGLDCNLHCRYCLNRRSARNAVPDKATEDFREYLKNLRPSQCEAVCATGGESLLYLDRVKEVFSYVPNQIHKKIISNSTLLTQEIVDYLNENNIEFHTSHDGEMTEYLRGVDILENHEILDLLRQIRVLRITSVITKYNCDIMKCYEYINDRLHREDMLYTVTPVFFNGCNQELIDGFDYDTYERSLLEFLMEHKQKSIYYADKPRKHNGLNFLLDGTVIDTPTMHVHGSIYDSKETIVRNKEQHSISEFCMSHNCKIRERCVAIPQIASPHICRIAKIVQDISGFFASNAHG